MARGSLVGVRVCVSASEQPTGTASPVKLLAFVHALAVAVFREGGHLVHGSHPSIVPILRAAAAEVFPVGGSREQITLVRPAPFMDDSFRTEIEDHESFATVLGIPARTDGPLISEPAEIRNLVPMREWMADRCDVVVAAGGKCNDRDKTGSGIPAEIEAFLARGKPAFVISACGGAAAAYVQNDPSLLDRLHNGLDANANRALDAALGDRSGQRAAVADGADRIVRQIGVLPRPSGRLNARAADGDSGSAAIRTQSIDTPRSPGMFRILCLDGGGIRGAFTAGVLASWDAMLPKGSPRGSFIKQFDLVAGTSTGSILAVGLAMGLEPGQLVQLYRENAAAIFPRTVGVKILLTRKYDSKPLRAVLTSLLGSQTLMNASRPLVIPTVEARRGDATLITTPHAPDRTAHRDTSAVDAVMASAAAPAFFGEADVDGPIATGKYIDGGMWANNPVLPAVMEAIGYCGAAPDRIDVLSLGTLMTEYDFEKSLGGGLAQWGPRISDLFFAAQETAAAEMARTFLGDTRLLRINDYVRTLPSLDDEQAVEQLIARGQEIGQKTFRSVRGRFLDGQPAPPWSPC